jgi:hypothetical protein
MAPLQTPEQSAAALKEIKKQAAKKRDALFILSLKEERRLKALEATEQERLKQERLTRKAAMEEQFQRDNVALIQEHQRKKREEQQLLQVPPQPLPPLPTWLENHDPVVLPPLEFPAQPLSPLTEPESPPPARPFTLPRRQVTEQLQTPVYPAFIPERQFVQQAETAEVTEAAISPTHPPIVPAYTTPERPPRRRIKPTIVVPQASPAPTIAEQRARAVAWNAETFGRRPADPVLSMQEQRTRAVAWTAEKYAELELLLQPTPSPPKEQLEERKLTAEEQEEELELERKQTPVLSPSTVPFSPMTPEAGEMPEQHDYLQMCDDISMDRSIPMVPATSLRVAPSRYGCYRGGVVVDAVGDALSATVDIAAGQAIAAFRGTTITMDTARIMQEERQGRYLIQISDDEVLDCRAEATARPPLCYASNANQAQGLLLHGRILTINHNNASVELTQAADLTWTATLYAVVHIPAMHDIMWSYGEEFEDGFDQSTFSTISSDVPSDEEGEEKEDTSDVETPFDPELSVEIPLDPDAPEHQHIGGIPRYRQVIAHLEGIGFDGRDAYPELAFDPNDDLSTIDADEDVNNIDESRKDA